MTVKIVIIACVLTALIMFEIKVLIDAAEYHKGETEYHLAQAEYYRAQTETEKAKTKHEKARAEAEKAEARRKNAQAAWIEREFAKKWIGKGFLK